MASIGMALTMVGLLVFAHLAEGTHLRFIVLNLMLLGFGFALFSSPHTNAVMGSSDKRYFGVAGGIRKFLLHGSFRGLRFGSAFCAGHRYLQRSRFTSTRSMHRAIAFPGCGPYDTERH